MDFPVLSRRRATDEVYDVLRGGILQHHFRPGERLHVDRLASSLGVSLTPVRHALQHLAAEGLVEIRPRSGTFVASLTSEDVIETFDIRRALECLAVETAVENLTEEQMKQLRRLVWKLAEPVESEQDRLRHEQDNSQFHRLIVEASGKRRLASMYEDLKAHIQIAMVHRISAEEAMERLADEQREHEEIMLALEARDKDRAVQALAQHINRANRALAGTLRRANANV